MVRTSRDIGVPRLVRLTVVVSCFQRKGPAKIYSFVDTISASLRHLLGERPRPRGTPKTALARLGNTPSQI